MEKEEVIDNSNKYKLVMIDQKHFVLFFNSVGSSTPFLQSRCFFFFFFSNRT